MSDRQVEITVRNVHTGRPVPAKMRAEGGNVIVYDLPLTGAFTLDPTKDVIDFQQAVDRVAGEALKQRQQRRRT